MGILMRYFKNEYKKRVMKVLPVLITFFLIILITLVTLTHMFLLR